MSATLYQLTNQMAEIEAMLEETGGEITPELEAVWNETSESLPQKVDGYNQVLRNLTAYASNLADEIKRLQALKKTLGGLTRSGKAGFPYADAPVVDVHKIPQDILHKFHPAVAVKKGEETAHLR